MYRSEISSSCLYHFTRSIDILISIIEKGFYPKVSEEDIAFMLPNYLEFPIGIPMVCFTDIPLNLASKHRSKYGEFGLGLKKSWGIEMGINPVSYIIKGTEMYKAFNYLQIYAVDCAEKLDEGQSDEKNRIYTHQMINAFMGYAGFLKEYSDGQDMEKKPFYDEREWRYLPPFVDEKNNMEGTCNRLLPEDLYMPSKKEALNDKMSELYSLKFEPEDIEEIVVPTKRERDIFIKKLQYTNYISQIDSLTDKIRIKENT